MATESTEGMPIPDALRAIAEWIEQGREIEYFDNGQWLKSIAFSHHGMFGYRPKPRPRTGVLYTGTTIGATNLGDAAGIEV